MSVEASMGCGVRLFRTLACSVILSLLAYSQDVKAVEWTVLDLGGQVISNAAGNCLSYQGLHDTIIQNATVGPCGDYGIHIENSQNVIIRRVTVHDTDEAAIFLDGVSSVRVTESVIRDSESGIVARASSSIDVLCNTIINSVGPVPAGQHVQFNSVSGANNRIMCNVGRNTFGETDPEDAISLFDSEGTALSPIQVLSNLIVGGGPSNSGGGIMLGDAGGAHIRAKKNVVVDSGQYGIAVAGGQDVEVSSNFIYARPQSFTNVGIYVWGQGTACNDITVQNNHVRWFASYGALNGFWNGGNCGSISGLSTNNFAAQIGPSIESLPAPECQCKFAGRVQEATNTENRSDLLIDFGSAGLWQRLDDTSWRRVHEGSPKGILAADLVGDDRDETIASFNGSGLFVRYASGSWAKLHPGVPSRFIAGNLDGSGKSDLVVDFGASGLWVLWNNATWSKLHGRWTQGLAVGDFDGNGTDELVADFGSSGLWMYVRGSGWTRVHRVSPSHIATGDLDGNGKDELIADFGKAGLWARYNNAAWVKLHNSGTQAIATGELDGNGEDEVLADFGDAGLWARYNNSSWVRLHRGSPIRMVTADLNGNGRLEAVLDFGRNGLWVRYDNGSWAQIHGSSGEALAAGRLN